MPGKQPVLDAHRDNKSIKGYDKWKPTNLAAIGASRDGHFVAAQLRDRGRSSEAAALAAVCSFRVPLPARQHLAWTCPSVAEKRRGLKV